MVTRGHGLKTEILVTLSILLGAALFLGGLLGLHMLTDALLEQRIQNIEFASEVLVDSYRNNNDARFADLLKPMFTRFSCEGWWLFNNELGLIDSFQQVERGPEVKMSKYLQQVNISRNVYRDVVFPPLLSLYWNDNAAMTLVLPVTGKSAPAGIIELQFSLAGIRSRVLYFQQVMLIYIILYGGVVSWAGFWLLKRNIINPARMLLAAIKKTGEGHLDTIVPVTGPTEIADLAANYNQMIAALRQSQSETANYVHSLENTNLKLQQIRNELIHSEKLASVGQLAAGVAHEIGNPLAALIGYLELLKGQASPSDLDLLQRCLNESARIDVLVREMLEFSRPTQSADVKDVFLHTEMRYCVNLLAHQGVFGTLDVDMSDITGLPAITGNPDKIRQVFINLLLNAAQACRSAGCIRVSCGHDDESLWCIIQDNGCGIPEHLRAKIFDPFFTTKPPGQGTGLGLSVCQRIVEDFGGRIVLICPESGGTIFKILFRLSANRA